MMSDPRSLTDRQDYWLTDARVYSLIWMGRCLERAEGVMRSVDAAALGAMQSENKDESFKLALKPVLAAWGVRPEGNDLRALLYENETSSVYRNLVRARSNAQQVGPLELMNAINLLVTEMERNEGLVNTPEQVHQLATVIVKLLANAYNVIETHWFRREPLSEHVIYRLFAQQQQQQGHHR